MVLENSLGKRKASLKTRVSIVVFIYSFIFLIGDRDFCIVSRSISKKPCIPVSGLLKSDVVRKRTRERERVEFQYTGQN